MKNRSMSLMKLMTSLGSVKQSLTFSLISVGWVVSASSHAWAGTCVGEFNSGRTVTVDMLTEGVLGTLRSVQVKTTKGNQVESQFTINAKEVVHYYEGARNAPESAMIGVFAFSGSRYVEVSYVGKDYSVDGAPLDLYKVLADKNRKKEAGNLISITQSNGSTLTLHDIVCALDHEV